MIFSSIPLSYLQGLLGKMNLNSLSQEQREVLTFLGFKSPSPGLFLSEEAAAAHNFLREFIVTAVRAQEVAETSNQCIQEHHADPDLPENKDTIYYSLFQIYEAFKTIRDTSED